MTPRQIEIFDAVMRCGSVSRAADLLGVSQPSLSRGLAEFERQLGFALFDRVRNRLVARPEAALLLREVEAHYRGLDALRAAAARIRDRGAGEIRLASLSTLGSSVCAPAVAAFLRKRAGVKVTLMVPPSREVRDGVASGCYDLGLAADEVDDAGVIAQVFATPRLVCAMPRGHPLAALATVTAADLTGHAFVALAAEDRARQRLERTLAEAGGAPLRVVAETLKSATACALIAAGVGVGLVNPYDLPAIDRSGLETRPFEPAVHARILLLQPLGVQKSLLVRDMIDALMAAR